MVGELPRQMRAHGQRLPTREIIFRKKAPLGAAHANSKRKNGRLLMGAVEIMLAIRHQRIVLQPLGNGLELEIILPLSLLKPGFIA